MRIDVCPWPEVKDFQQKTGITPGLQELSADQILAIFEAGFDVQIRHSGEESRLYVSPGGRGFGQRG